ncbi:MAG TPA: polysaccharide deacetylase family protein [Acidimicrobiia bacterium]|jgi:peptidoglycan/xylan/chitin deacetylase (PgdA/CDA1 family)
MSLARTAGKLLFVGLDRMAPVPGAPRVLIYHQVGSGLGRQMEVTIADFAGQLDWIEQNREVVSFDEAVARWDEPGADRLVALTFDDGYADTFTTAFPMLVDKGFPFLVYLATEPIETGRPLGPQVGADPLTWDQIVGMLGSGLATIGAHTHRHTDLRDLPLDAVEEELGLCDELIERRLGIHARHFAYPWGYWSESAARLVDARYETAVIAATPTPGKRLDRFKIHRYPVQLSDGLRFFPARLRGGLRFEERARRRLKGYSGP